MTDENEKLRRLSDRALQLQEDLTLPTEEEWDNEATGRYQRKLDNLLGDKDFMDGLFAAGKAAQRRKMLEDGYEDGTIIDGQAIEVNPPKLIEK